MAYKMEIINYAHTLFLQGKSFATIADILTDKFKKSVRPQTVFSWAKKYDWEESRKEVMLATRKEIQRREESRLVELGKKARNLADKLYEDLIANDSPKIGSKEGGAYAFKAIAEFELMIEKNRGNVSPAILAQSIMEVMMDIPSIRKVIEKEWDKVARGLAEKMPNAIVELNEK